ncbi:MAG: TIGR03032 family protein [Marinoscillum sp.]|uniref:TIGR03032 family protein n=1 Tax=Marinoscillum sp. TaxID=2024838 RepID=UPI0032F93273
MEESPNVPPPFSYRFSPNVPELLQALKCSLAISTYQTGKVIIFSPKDQDSLVQLPRNFNRPMGMAISGNKWAIATRDQLLVTSNAPGLAANYKPNPNTYDALYVPRVSYNTGTLDIHDLSWAKEKLIAVNTLFCCLMENSDEFSFTPIWKPHFISELMPEDRCHLNGMALKNEQPKYVTALGATNTPRGWKDGMLTSGILMDVDSNEIIGNNLPVPHSPRLYSDGLFMLLSATGEVVKVNPETGKYDVLTKLNGFLRGMDRVGDYLFVAMSRLRQGSSLFKEAPIAKESVHCGISIIYIPSGQQVGFIVYNNTVEELFEVKALRNTLRPNVLNMDKGVHQQTIVTSDQVFWTEADDNKS